MVSPWCGHDRADRPEGSARAFAIASRVSMLGICSASDCSTIVFGRGTCVVHDEPRTAVDPRETTRSASLPAPPGGAGEALSPIGSASRA